MSAIKTPFDPRPMPLIATVRPADGACVQITWAAGTRVGRTETVDLSPAINKYRVYTELRNKRDLLRTVEVGNDGQILEWDGGRFDMAATTLEHLAEEQMTGADFCDFLHRHNLTRQEAAAELGRSLRAIQEYTKCHDPLPRVVALACRGFEAKKSLALGAPDHALLHDCSFVWAGSFFPTGLMTYSYVTGDNHANDDYQEPIAYGVQRAKA